MISNPIHNITIHMFNVFDCALFRLRRLPQVGLNVKVKEEDGHNGGEALNVGDEDPGVVTFHPQELRIVYRHDEKLCLKQKPISVIRPMIYKRRDQKIKCEY